MSVNNGTASDTPMQFYNYPGPPTKWVCFVFVVLFGVSFLWHCYQTYRCRLWWAIPTIDIAAFGEVVGWAGRLWSSNDATLKTPFMIQTICLVLAPTPFIAAIFITFARITERMGAQYTRVPPRWYSKIFLTCDIVSLFIQGGGGGIAASATDPDKTKLGGSIMLTGIVFQLISVTAFMALVAEYFIRFYYDIPLQTKSSVPLATDTVHRRSKRNWNGKLKALSGGLAIIIVCIYARSIYRSIELANGWDGPIARSQVLFNVLDGAMLVICLYSFNVFYPGRLLVPDYGSTQTVTSEDNIDLVPTYRFNA